MSGHPNRRLVVALAAGAGLLALVAWLAHVASVTAQEPLPPPPELSPALPADASAEANAEVLTRGPIHEAYAAPGAGSATTGLIVAKRPPNPIEEQAPDVKPQGNDSTWIPGYWSWDEERKDYIWVSGVWRVPPPSSRWVPGYWQEGQGGFQWVSGYWMPNAKSEVTYLPQPPATLEQGPSSPSPGDTYFWVPGQWQWAMDHYVWVPGHWGASRPDLVWVYPTYYWCPRGWVYSAGYWDYPLERRGLMFAPVYFAGPVVYYRPAVCVDVGIVTCSLFCHPVYRHYYYGDFYADHYVAIGIRPWFVFNGPRHGYDPLFCYYRVYHRNDPHWEANLHGWHEYYRGHPEMRPPHTLAEQRRLLADPRAQSRPDIHTLAVGHPVGQLANNPNSPLKVQPVSMSEKAAVQQSAKQVSNFQSERSQLESKGAQGRAVGAAGPATADKASFAKLPSFQAANTKTGTAAGAASTAKPAAQRPAPRSNGTNPWGQRQSTKSARNPRQDQSKGEK
jgi:hypothetical protein